MPKYQYTLPDHKITHSKIDIADLDVDPNAQRSLNVNRAKAIARNLVPGALGSLVVSERSGGKRFIVDGMHRRYACQVNGITEVAAEIHYGLTVQEEAVLFLIKNRESAKPNAFDQYKVGLTAGLPLYVDTEAVLMTHHLSMGSTGVNSIGAVAGVLRVTDTYGPEILDKTLSVAEMAWGRSAATWDGMLLGGIGMFLGRHGQDVDDLGELATKIAREGIAQHWVSKVVTFASAGGTQHTGTSNRVSTMYDLVVRAYNKGRRTRKIKTT